MSNYYYQQQNEEFVADWGAFENDTSYYEDESFSQDASVGTDLSPVDVMNFPSSSSIRRRQQQQEEADYEATEMQQKLAARLSLPSRNRRSTMSGASAIPTASATSRLPPKSKSLEGKSSAAVTAIAAEARVGGEKRQIPRRTKSEARPRLPPSRKANYSTGDASKESTSSSQERRRTRASTKGSRRSSASPSSEEREAPRRIQRRPTGSHSKRESATAEQKEGSSVNRAARIKELGLAFKAATILEKGVQARTEHLKMDIHM